MSRAKTERLFNLVVALLSARRYLTKEELRQAVAGYSQESDEAFERQFERDKDELRSMGINVATGSNNPLFDDEVGYRIARADYELPKVEFSAAEVAVLAIAAQSWQQSLMTQTTQKAWTKLRAAGIEPDTERLGALSTHLSATEPAFEVLWPALAARRRVQFSYRGEQRTVEPWRLVSRRGAWYLIGFDHLRQAARAFKLTRIEDTPKPIGKQAAYAMPSQEQISTHVQSLSPAAPRLTALVAITPNGAPDLRRDATFVRTERDGEVDVYRVPYATEEELVDLVCSNAADATLLEPKALRAQVIARLERWDT